MFEESFTEGRVVLRSRHGHFTLGPVTEARALHSHLAVGSTSSPLDRRATTAYLDSSRAITESSDVKTPGDQSLSVTTWFDQLGRVRKTVNNSTQATVQRRYRLSGSSYELESTPYITTADATMGWHRTARDQDGRVTGVAHFDGSALPSPWGTSTSSTGSTGVVYGNSTSSPIAATAQHSDEAGVTRLQYLDGLGRLTKVTENGLAVSTTYGYDALGNLTSVTPPSGTGRSFVYNSLGWLKQAVNPESGTINYTYTATGQVYTRTSNEHSASYGYNERDQMTSKSVDGVNSYFNYALTGSHRRGRLGTATKSKNIVDYVYDYLAYDALGRPTSGRLTVGGTQIYSTGLSYYAGGGVYQATYPSGRVVTTDYDAAGRETTVTGAYNGSTVNYVTAQSYFPFGGVSGRTLGSGLQETNTANSRMQLTELKATSPFGNPADGMNLMKLTVTYPGTTNNGSPSGQTITRAAPPASSPAAATWTQSYGYDGVGRLTSASETGSNWSQTYVYDSRGNRAVLSTSSMPSASGLTPQTASTTSVPYDSNNRWSGMSYSGDGNLNSVGGYCGFSRNRSLILL